MQVFFLENIVHCESNADKVQQQRGRWEAASSGYESQCGVALDDAQMPAISASASCQDLKAGGVLFLPCGRGVFAFEAGFAPNAGA